MTASETPTAWQASACSEVLDSLNANMMMMTTTTMYDDDDDGDGDDDNDDANHDADD